MREGGRNGGLDEGFKEEKDRKRKGGREGGRKGTNKQKSGRPVEYIHSGLNRALPSNQCNSMSLTHHLTCQPLC